MIAKAAKAEKVVALHTKFVDAKAAILANYSGLNVQQLAELRSQLRAAAVELHVVKNTLGSAGCGGNWFCTHWQTILSGQHRWRSHSMMQ